MSVTEAVIMAAGVGNRLRPFTDTRPKSLLEVGGVSLMERHLKHLASGGIQRTTIVLGHCGDQIRERFGNEYGPMSIRYIENSDYRRGSILSLKAGLAGLSGATVCMDADVLYHPEVLHRLLRTKDAVCFLLDPTAEETGEEMMLAVRDGAVRRIARTVGKEWDLVGEGVGFFVLGGKALPQARTILDAFAERGEIDVEYEDGLNQLLEEIPGAFVEVGDLPWTEIDFEEDLKKADRILAHLQEMGAAE